MILLILCFSLSLLSSVGSRCLHNHLPMIALTRSQEGNQGLEKLLAMRGISSVQLPCVEIVEKNIPAHHFKECDIVVVTSAKVYILFFVNNLNDSRERPWLVIHG
jgi:uroporphyrinogen-III synthase